MATQAFPARAAPRLASLADSRVAAAALFLFLVGASLYTRTRAIDAGFWIDEALSVGIASFPLTEIPGVLVQDGAPPLYYLLLHVWMEVFGSSETATHALSLVFALLAIPAALWAGYSLFGRRAGWVAAALAALNPFLTIYAQETRMYSLVILLSLVATAAFVHGFVHRRRRYVVVFALTLALMLYTHYWGAFFALGALAALAVCARETRERRPLLLDAALAFGAVGLALAPWIPTLLEQAAHTGAPWSRTPSPLGLLGGLTAVLSGQGTLVAVLFGAGIGIAAVVRAAGSIERTAFLAMIAIGGGTLLSAWIFSQLTPAWASRYLAVVVGPVLLLTAAGVARSGRLGLVALTLVVFFWGAFRADSSKANVREMGQRFAGQVEPGDLVISTQPEQVPALAYYFPPGLRYATPLGPVEEPRVMDWRDAADRLAASNVERSLTPLLDDVPVGGRVLLVRPLIRNEDEWKAEWTALIRIRSWSWARALRRDARFTSTTSAVPPYTEHVPRGVRIELFTKSKSG